MNELSDQQKAEEIKSCASNSVCNCWRVGECAHAEAKRWTEIMNAVCERCEEFKRAIANVPHGSGVWQILKRLQGEHLSEHDRKIVKGV